MAYTRNIGFGSGVMIATPSVANPTPVRLGILQEVNIDVAFTTKQLFGQFQYPVAIGRGTAKITGKAKYAEINSAALGLFFGLTPAANSILIAESEAGSIPATPFAVTVANSATFDADLGVNFALTGQPLTRVASAPATGQYSMVAGVYTFAAADTLLGVLITYSYSTVVAPSKTITITNPLLGAAAEFQVDCVIYDPKLAQQTGIRLFACVASKLTLPTKLEDFVIEEFDFEAYANSANQIGRLFLPN